MKKFKDYIVIIPLIFTIFFILYKIYNFSTYVYNSNKLAESIKEQNILKNIIKSLILEREIVNSKKNNFYNIDILRKKTDDDIDALISFKPEKQDETISIKSQVEILRQRITSNYIFLNIFLSFYRNINDSIINGNSKFLDLKSLNNELRTYIIILNDIYINASKINFNREYIQKAITNNEQVSSNNILNWLQADISNLIDIKFLPKNESKERMINFLNTSKNSGSLKKIFEEGNKLSELKKKNITNEELYLIDNFQKDKFVFLLEASNIIESELSIKNSIILKRYKQNIILSVALLMIFIFITINIIKKIKELKIIKENIRLAKDSFYDNQDELNLENYNTILNFKDIYENLKKSHKKIITLNKIKSKYIKKATQRQKMQLEEKLHSISFLRKSYTSSEQLKALSVLEENYSKEYSTFNDILNTVYFENNELEKSEVVFNPQDVFSIALESRINEINKKNINYATFIDPKIKNNLIGDKDKIINTISNILFCAIYQCNQYSKIIVKIKQVINSKNNDVANILFTIKNNADSTLENFIQNEDVDIETIDDEYMQFWLSLSSLYLKSMQSKLKIKSSKDIGNEFSFEIVLKTMNEIEEYQNLNNKIPIAYIDDLDKDYNIFFKKTLQDIGLNPTVFSSLNKVDNIKNYRIIFTRKTKDISYDSQNIISIKDPLTPIKILQYLQKNTDIKSTQKFILNKPQILIIENNNINLNIIKHSFEKYNVDITSASDHKNIEELTKNKRFDLFLMDTDAYGIKSLEIAKKYKNNEIGRHTPIIAMISSAGSISPEQSLTVFDEYIKKPFSKKNLRKILTSFIPNFDTFLNNNNIYKKSYNILLFKKSPIENKIFAGALSEFNTYLTTADSFEEFENYIKNKIYGLIFIDDNEKNFDTKKALNLIEDSRILFGIDTKLFIFSNKSRNNFSIKPYIKILSPQINKAQLVEIVKKEIMGGM
ncbi:response regulator [Campylobacter pinnipediorum]|uniref:response regulator n=1 Tax=Campylobacter pinnipediorum TaxID=1965231 RepID=UPI00084D3A8F|nr:response regulator [Campylobacter pinnipediorum]